jgi:Uma2 family endonuclease
MTAHTAQQTKQGFSYKNYYGWDDGKRWELIDGVEYDMGPAPLRRHQDVAGELFFRLYSFFKDKKCKVYVAPFDVRLSELENATDEEIFTVVQPDITVVCDSSKLDDRGCKGAPDLVVEILSPSSAGRDMKTKRDLYEKHGIREYWIIHPHDRIAMVYLLDADRRYGKAAVYEQDDMMESVIFAGLSIRLSDLFASA